MPKTSMIILLHTSKTMRVMPARELLQQPSLQSKATQLASYIKTLSPSQLASTMHVSATLALKTHEQFAEWNTTPQMQSLAIDSFIGDIYSGLRADMLSQSDREYANSCLYILSGLYGVLRPFDGIMPYRLEMGYKLPEGLYKNLYSFWGDEVAKILPKTELVINLAAVEYSHVVIPYLIDAQIIAPKFLTINKATGEPVFVVVHAKIARGAFARWLLTSRISDVVKLKEFTDLGYKFDAELSSLNEPVFVCKEFGGVGLSMRLL